MSLPRIALLELHDPEPELRERIEHKVVPPILNVTDPVGVPLTSLVTVAE
jgi:hypothetical protein